MADPIALAETHRVAQVEATATVQKALGDVFDRQLNPAALDASFPTYLRSSLAVIAGGRQNAVSLAKLYYGKSRELAGLEAIVPDIAVPAIDLEAVATSLAVTGPASIKKQLSSGVGLHYAVNAAKAATLAAGKRHVLNGGREAIVAAVQADDKAHGWARVSDGAPCAFCAMLVSRGPVYRSRGTADFKAHDRCGCGIRPFFEGDPTGGWSPDARALSELWKDAGAGGFKAAYADALITPDSAVFQTFTDKVGKTISLPAQRAANEAARDAYRKAQAAKAALEEAQKATEDAAALLAAEQEAKAAAAEAAKVKKWLNKPAPKKPTPPAPPAKVGPAAFDPWLEKSKKRFADFAAKTGNPKNDLTKSLNWDYFQRVVKDHDLSALQYLKSNHYIDEALEREALAAMKHAEQLVPGTEEAYKKALRSFKNRSTRYDRYLAEWREVNGITAPQLTGWENALRHTTDADGVRWANANLKVATGTERDAIQRYTGSSFRPWNTALRGNASPEPPKGTWGKPTREADAGFRELDEAIVVNRGTNWDEFALGDGSRMAYIPPPPPEDLIGSVQVQHGYWSTSVGRSAAFSGNVQMKILLPKGHKVSWAMPYSQFSSERELLVQRSSRFLIHDVYKDPQGQWIVEAEVIPMDVPDDQLAGLMPTPATEKFTAR